MKISQAMEMEKENLEEIRVVEEEDDAHQTVKEDLTETINKQIGKLSMEEQENRRIVAIEDVDIEETNKDLDNSVACKILTQKPYSMGSVFRHHAAHLGSGGES